MTANQRRFEKFEKLERNLASFQFALDGGIGQTDYDDNT